MSKGKKFVSDGNCLKKVVFFLKKKIYMYICDVEKILLCVA